MDEKKDLVQVIRDNPGCIATVDNDCWYLHKAPPKPIDDMTDDEYDEWQKNGEIANDSNVKRLGDGGYGSGCIYGGDLLQALAVIVGVKIESV